MKTIRTTCILAVVLLGLLALGTLGAAWGVAAEPGGGQVSLQLEANVPAASAVAPPMQNSSSRNAVFYAIAFTVGISCASAGYAVGKVGAAALGAAAEKPELLGRAIIFVGLAEGIAIYGLIIGIMLIRLLG